MTPRQRPDPAPRTWQPGRSTTRQQASRFSPPATRQEVSLELAWSMLQFIPAEDRSLWVKIGGILKDEFRDAGFPLWDEWSQTSEKYLARDASTVWRSLGRNPVRASLGSLIFLAKEHGWTPDRHLPEPVPKSRQAPPPGKDTTAYALRIWLSASTEDATVGSHPYAVRKGITWAAGAGRAPVTGRVVGNQTDCLVVPIRTDATGKVQGVQCINPDGAKQTFGRITGGCLVLGNTLDRRIPWYVAEGWASAVSVVFHHSKGNAVCAVAFGKNNLDPTAEILERVFDPPEILVLREVD